MNAATGRAAGIRRAVVIDELGIAIGVHEAYRLKSAYQLLFSREGDELAPAGVKASIVPLLAGKPTPYADFLATLSEDSLPQVASLGCALGLANYGNLDIDGLDLWIGHDPLLHGDLSQWFADALEPDAFESPMRPNKMFCEFPGKDDPQGLQRLGGEMRERGFAFAIEALKPNRPDEEQIYAIGPDVVKIDAGWLAQSCQDAATARLLATVMARLRGHSVKVLVEGISDAMQLRAALDCEADLFRGDHLGGAVLGGAVFETGRQPIRRLLSGGGQFFGRSIA